MSIDKPNKKVKPLAPDIGLTSPVPGSMMDKFNKALQKILAVPKKNIK
jgi:hypothetical protein